MDTDKVSVEYYKAKAQYFINTDYATVRKVTKNEDYFPEKTKYPELMKFAMFIGASPEDIIFNAKWLKVASVEVIKNAFNKIFITINESQTSNHFYGARDFDVKDMKPVAIITNKSSGYSLKSGKFYQVSSTKLKVKGSENFEVKKELEVAAGILESIVSGREETEKKEEKGEKEEATEITVIKKKEKVEKKKVEVEEEEEEEEVKGNSNRSKIFENMDNEVAINILTNIKSSWENNSELKNLLTTFDKNPGIFSGTYSVKEQNLIISLFKDDTESDRLQHFKLLLLAPFLGNFTKAQSKTLIDDTTNKEYKIFNAIKSWIESKIQNIKNMKKMFSALQKRGLEFLLLLSDEDLLLELKALKNLIIFDLDGKKAHEVRFTLLALLQDGMTADVLLNAHNSLKPNTPDNIKKFLYVRFVDRLMFKVKSYPQKEITSKIREEMGVTKLGDHKDKVKEVLDEKVKSLSSFKDGDVFKKKNESEKKKFEVQYVAYKELRDYF